MGIDFKREISQIACSLIATFGGFCLGTILGWSSPAESKMFEEWNLENDSGGPGWVSSVMTLGAGLSVLPVPFVMDIVGRKIAMLIFSALLCASWVGLAFVNGVPAGIAGRFFNGFFGGAFTLLSPTYVGEICEPNVRGAMGSSFQFWIVIGILFSYCVGPYVDLMTYSFICAIMPIILFVLILLVCPETPYYLVMKNADTGKIDKVFGYLRGSGFDFSAERKATERQIADSEEKKKVGRWKKFGIKANQKAFAIVMIAMLGQQFSGVNVLIFFGTGIFQSAVSWDAKYCNIILGVVQFLATAVSVVLVDRAGRKLLLYISFVIMAICLFVMGVYFQWLSEHKTIEIQIIPVLALNIYLVGFSLGAGPVPFAILGETFAPDIKGLAGSICAMSNWMLAFIVTKTFHPLSDAITIQGIFWVFSAFCVVFLILNKLVLIETKGKTLEEIQEQLVN